jgi:hypothetical protein
MVFPDEVVKDAWELVEGRCECSRVDHQHPDGKCNRHLLWENRAQFGFGAWQAHPIDGNKDHCNLTNCEIICWNCLVKM